MSPKQKELSKELAHEAALATDACLAVLNSDGFVEALDQLHNLDPCTRKDAIVLMLLDTILEESGYSDDKVSMLSSWVLGAITKDYNLSKLASHGTVAMSGLTDKEYDISLELSVKSIEEIRDRSQCH